ncbi:MAG: indolepyruvate oxidoreductase subunit beta [Thermoprotei archaeon]|nr:indolepyruvate oxidoreductase subunit beta [Thermoprotei archaeon]
MKEGLNIIVAGVGGQGILSLARVLGEAAVLEGLEALVAETHGLSQRGGSVIVHVRIGENIEAPLIPVGEADIMISMEAMETLRSIGYMRRGGVIVSDTLIIPPSIPGVKPLKLEDIVGAIKSAGLEAHFISASEEAKRLGDFRTANIVLLGYAYKVSKIKDLISLHSLMKAVETLPGRDLNLKALTLYATPDANLERARGWV